MSDLTLGHSFKVRQGQPNLKVHITHLLVLKICNVKTTYRKSWSGNLLIWSDLTLDPSFMVKQWFTGFELSFNKFALVLRCVGLVLLFLFNAVANKMETST